LESSLEINDDSLKMKIIYQKQKFISFAFPMTIKSTQSLNDG